MPPRDVFTCRRCGHCCQGAGGIVLAERDIERLSLHLGISRAALLSRYAETVGGMPRLVSGPDGYCVFYRDGCGIHPARPDVCRAWPFFRGNILDPESLAMAREDCPGIDPEASHEEFARQGKAYLRRHGLARTGGEGVPRALVVIVEENPGETEHGRPNLDAS
jgi:Fe-S-cluster containining protein